MSKKTNAMRSLDQNKLSYDILTYEANDGEIDGLSVAKKVDRPKELVFKTLVIQGHSKSYYVAVIPVDEHLNIKKISKVLNEKKVEMIPVKDIQKITGYIRGGCSPIGMKKSFPTVVDEKICELDKVVFSAGKIGMQIEMSANEFIEHIKATTSDIVDA